MFNMLKSLAPCINGPWMPHRKFAAEQMRKMDVKPGDILCRLGNGYLFGVFWFSNFIANVTHSRYSHAAMITDVYEDDIVIIDVSNNGMRRQFAAEWTDEVWGQDILVVRYNGDPLIPLSAAENVSLCDEVPINKLPGWKRRYNWFAKLNGIKPISPVFCVGNENIGLLSSKDLVKVGRIVLPTIRRHNITHEKPIYAGA
jgi:hypothetical protein